MENEKKKTFLGVVTDIFEVNFDNSRTFAEVCTSLHFYLMPLFYIHCWWLSNCQPGFYRWGHFFENPLPVLVLLKLEISPNCIPRHRELGPCSDKTWQIYTTQNHNYQNTDQNYKRIAKKNYKLSKKLSKCKIAQNKRNKAIKNNKFMKPWIICSRQSLVPSVEVWMRRGVKEIWRYHFCIAYIL